MDEIDKAALIFLRDLIGDTTARLEYMFGTLAKEGEAGKKRLLEHDIYFIEDPAIALMMYQTFDEWSRFRREPSIREKIGNGIVTAYRTLKNIIW